MNYNIDTLIENLSNPEYKLSKETKNDLIDILKEYRSLKYNSELSKEESNLLRDCISEVESIEESIIDELSEINECTEDELRSMTYECDGRDSDELYLKFGNILFEYDENKSCRFDRINDKLQEHLNRTGNYVSFTCPDGFSTQDSHEYLFHENKCKEDDLKWLRVNSKYSIFVDKINEFGW